MRLFVAIDLPESIKDTLAGMCEGLAGAKWIDDDQFHLTLAFIGDCDDASFNDIKYHLGLVKGLPLTISLKKLGIFPPKGRPTTLWAGVQHDDSLTILQKRISKKLDSLGISLDKRRYHPHVTLARLRHTPENKLAHYLAHHALFQSEDFEVDEFQLYSSILSSHGAEHSIEESYPLA